MKKLLKYLMITLMTVTMMMTMTMIMIMAMTHYRPDFWQMANMEYLYGFWGNGYGVLSIEYSYPTSLQ